MAFRTPRLPVLARRILLVAPAVLLLSSQPSHPAENQRPELTDLSLEELLEVELIPIDVMGSGHIHSQGEWMVGYRHGYMAMQGLRDGTMRLPAADVLATYPIAPVEMTMEMRMTEVMYGMTDRLTLMVMVPYLRLQMDHRTRGGASFTTTAEGFGDVQLMAHYALTRGNPHWWVVGGALGLPTGSIDERGDTPAGSDQPLPYPMQLGSGSLEVAPLLNYIYQEENWLAGLHVDVRLPVEDNDRGYRVGESARLDLFYSHEITDRIAPTVRLSGAIWGDYDGINPRLDPMMVPTADPDLRGGERIDLAVGLTVLLKGGRGRHHVVVEAAMPVHESLDGPQLESEWTALAGWQWSF